MSRAPAGTGVAPTLRVEVPASRDSIRFLSDLVQLYLEEGVGLPPEQPELVHVRLAIMEAVTNVVRHAYPPGVAGPVILEMRRDGRHLLSVVGDQAGRFDPLAGNGPRLPDPADLKEGGYGLGIIDKVMDEVAHEYQPDLGNRLLMKKRFWE